MRWTGVAVIGALLAGALVFVGARQPITIGAVYPIGGSQGPGGTEEFRGVSLAGTYVNERGGINGRPIRLRLEQADSRDAAPGAIRRLARAGITTVVGSYGSTISRPAAGAATRLGLLFWETGAVGELSMETLQGDRVFRF